MPKKIKDQKYYMLLCQEALQEIMKTPKDQPQRYAILKKRAEKYLKKAKSFESSDQSMDKQDQ